MAIQPLMELQQGAWYPSQKMSQLEDSVEVLKASLIQLREIDLPEMSTVEGVQHLELVSPVLLTLIYRVNDAVHNLFDSTNRDDSFQVYSPALTGARIIRETALIAIMADEIYRKSLTEVFGKSEAEVEKMVKCYTTDVTPFPPLFTEQEAILKKENLNFRSKLGNARRILQDRNSKISALEADLALIRDALELESDSHSENLSGQRKTIEHLEKVVKELTSRNNALEEQARWCPHCAV